MNPTPPVTPGRASPASAVNVAIAAALGWTHLSEKPVLNGRPPDRTWNATVPNYYGSLDACAEFEKTLDSESQRMAYSIRLEKILDRDAPEHEIIFEWAATSPQRCEAFLRVKNLWPPATA